VLTELSFPGGLAAADAFVPLDPLGGGAAALDWSRVPREARPQAALLQRSLLQLPEPGRNVSSEAQAARCRRKELQVESFHVLLSPLIAASAGSRRLRVVDFGCGTGCLSLPLAALLPCADFLCVDMDAQALRILDSRAAAAGLNNVTTLCKRVEIFDSPQFDIALALHACGNCTDYVMLQAVLHRAAYIVCPCCLGKLAFSLSGGSSFSPLPDKTAHAAAGLPPLTHPRSAWLRDHLGDDSTARFAQLAAAADVSHGEAEDAQLLLNGGVQPLALRLSRAAKLNLELDRSASAREAGYSVAQFTMLKPRLQAKNALLLGVPPDGAHPLAREWRAAVHRLTAETVSQVDVNSTSTY
jgi:SAM-dependent methyltransferase